MTKEIIYICDPGTNWIGNMDLLKRIAFESKKAGFTFLKPQLFDATVLYSDLNNPFYDLQCKCSMTLEQAMEINEYCDSIKLKCIFSPFDIPRLNWINIMGIDTVKVASSMSNNTEFLSEISNMGLFPIITISPQHKPLKLHEYTNLFGKDGFKLLAGSSKYPSMIKDYDLTDIKLYKGLSNHVLDNGALAYASVACDADTLEFHVCHTYVNSPDMCVSYPMNKISEIINNCNAISEII